MMDGRFNWPVLLRAGVYGLRLLPRDFWSLTPAEFSIMLGAGTRPAMGRRRLEELVKAWPDAPKGSRNLPGPANRQAAPDE